MTIRTPMADHPYPGYPKAILQDVAVAQAGTIWRANGDHWKPKWNFRFYGVPINRQFGEHVAKQNKLAIFAVRQRSELVVRVS